MGNDMICAMYHVYHNHKFIVQGSRFRVQGSGFRVRGSGFGVRPRGVLPFDYVRKLYSPVRSEELGVRSDGAAHKNQKRRGVLIALRAHRHFERSREIFIAERSSPDMRQHQDIVFPRRIHADSRVQ